VGTRRFEVIGADGAVVGKGKYIVIWMAGNSIETS
jgi:hypothetical protein